MVVQFKILQKKVLHLVVQLFNITLKILKHLMQTQLLKLKIKTTKLGAELVVIMVRKEELTFGKKQEDTAHFQLT